MPLTKKDFEDIRTWPDRVKERMEQERTYTVERACFNCGSNYKVTRPFGEPVGKTKCTKCGC